MKPFDILDEILGNPAKIRVLRHLTKSFEGRTGRQLAQAAKVSPPSVLKALDALLKQGILDKRVIGKSYNFRLNTKHILVEKGLLPLFRLETHLLVELGELLRKQFSQGIETAVWHGSVARGSADHQSDWDILLLTSDAKTADKIREVLPEKTPAWGARFSSHLDIQVMPADRFRKKFKEGNSFARNVYEDYSSAWVSNPIFGKSLTLLLGEHHDKKNTHRSR